MIGDETKAMLDKQGKADGWKMSIGVQELSRMINDHYVYADKTPWIWEMINTGYVYFLARPRRFGKSLLVSTLHEYFDGNRELFKDLYIGQVEKEWKKYPIFRFDFSGEKYCDDDTLDKFLNKKLMVYEEIYGTKPYDYSLPSRFQSLLETAYKKTGLECVVLVDEYDKPLLESEDNPARNADYKSTFKSFFGVLKPYSKYVKFAFITGITKLRNVSIFSDLNNLNDISQDEKYSSICGITQDELVKYYTPAIQKMADRRGISFDECIVLLKAMYDGYHFAEDLTDIYNPFSVVNALSKCNPSSYWVSQSTPTYLLHRLERGKGKWQAFDYAEGKRVPSNLLGEIEIVPRDDPTALLYQSGYLTIKSYDEESDMFTLTYPNKEIRTGFVKWIVPLYIDVPQDTMAMTVQDLKDSLAAGDLDTFFSCFKEVYAAVPYYAGTEDKDKVLERDFHNVASITFVLLGAFVMCEPHFSRGRADCVVENKDYVYLFEFKRGKSADEALAQLETHGYTERYAGDKRQVVKVGVSFSSETRNIEEWKRGA